MKMQSVKQLVLLLVVCNVVAAKTPPELATRELHDAREVQLTSREAWLQAQMIRALEEVDGGAAVRSGEAPELEARSLDMPEGAVDARGLPPVAGFFLNVGEIVKRAWADYWNGMKRDVGILDFRPPGYQRRRAHRAEKVLEAPAVTARSVEEPVSKASSHKPRSDYRDRRRRFENDQMVERDSSSSLSDDMASRHHLEHKPTYRERRRRWDEGQIARRDTLDILDTRDTSMTGALVGSLDARHHLESGENYKQRRKRWDDGQMATRDTVDDLEARHHGDGLDYKQRRRRWDDGQMATRDIVDDLEARHHEESLATRMSWFGKALLLYRSEKSNPDAPLPSPSRDNPLWNRVKRSL